MSCTKSKIAEVMGVEGYKINNAFRQTDLETAEKIKAAAIQLGGDIEIEVVKTVVKIKIVESK